MPLVSKTVEVAASAESIMAIVADFESYPLWNDEVKGCWVLARYEDGRPSQLRLDVVVQGQAGTFITAVYYPGENQIYTVLQQGEFFEKQEQKFSVVPIGATNFVDRRFRRRDQAAHSQDDGEEGDRRHAGLSGREPQGARRAAGRQPVALTRRRTACAARQLHSPISSSRVGQSLRGVGELAAGEPDDGVDIVAAQRLDQLAVAGHRGGTPRRITRIDLPRQVPRDVQQEPGQLDPAGHTVERPVERELRRDDLLRVAAVDGRGEALVESLQLLDLCVGDPFGSRRRELLGDGGLQPEDVLDVASRSAAPPHALGAARAAPCPRRAGCAAPHAPA